MNTSSAPLTFQFKMSSASKKHAIAEDYVFFFKKDAFSEAEGCVAFYKKRPCLHLFNSNEDLTFIKSLI